MSSTVKFIYFLSQSLFLSLRNKVQQSPKECVLDKG